MMMDRLCLRVFVSIILIYATGAFQIQHSYHRRHTQLFTYGRGDEIWPPTNVDQPIRLEDNFPGGKIPSIAEEAFREAEATPQLMSWRQSLRRLPKLLRSAASRQQMSKDEATRNVSSSIAMAFALTLSGYIAIRDYLVLIAITGYFSILVIWAQSTRDDGITPNLPALPPRGHVPQIVDEPLLYRLSRSKAYETWLRLGALLGLAGPVLLVGASSFVEAVSRDRLCGRSLFFISCQSVTEILAKKYIWPLPLRILATILYNAVRLVYIFKWTQSAPQVYGKLLASLNLAYWSLNLFGFLPLACLRYMRAHFFGVEAMEVRTRQGLESTII